MDTDSHYPVYFFMSETSGEKPYEEFYDENDQLDTDRFTALGVINNNHHQSFNQISDLIKTFQSLFDSENISKSDVIRLISKYLPDFNHLEKGKN